MDELKPVPELTPLEAQPYLSEGALLLDIREWAEWAESRIPGAEYKPMSEINDWYQELPEDRVVILQCRTGNRSGMAANALINQAHMTKVFNLAGGIIAWDESGLPIDSTPPAPR